MHGKIGPNKGLTKLNCERIKVAGEKISKVMKFNYASGLCNTKGEKMECGENLLGVKDKLKKSMKN